MCVNPIHIRNKKLEANTFLHGADKASLLVPCGHCAQCVQRKIDDFTFRGFFEYLDTKRKGGFTLFQTLTYSEQYVPYHDGFRYFRKKDVQLFLKRLRVSLERDGYNVDGNLKYICTSEYGERRHRPHYHILFYVTFPIDFDIFDKYVSYCWTHLRSFGDERVPIGLTDSSQSYKRVVNSIYGIRYVCKYVGKGTKVVDAIRYSYSHHSHLNRFVYDWCTLNGVKYDNLKDWQLSKIWSCYKLSNPDFPDDFQLLPFVLQSHNIGMSFLQTCSYEELFDVVDINCLSPKGYKSYSVPVYYIRKVFYDYDKESKRFILNELGRDYVSHNNDLDIEEITQICNIRNEVLDKLCFKVTDGKFSNVSSMVDSFLDGRSVSDFVRYSVFLMGREISPLFSFLDFSSLDAYSLSVIQNELEQDCHVCDSSLYKVEKYSTLLQDYIATDYQLGELPFYDELPQFRGYLELADILRRIKQEMAVYLNLKISEDMRMERLQACAKSYVSQDDCLIL